jgi:hypothetical protein
MFCLKRVSIRNVTFLNLAFIVWLANLVVDVS